MLPLSHIHVVQSNKVAVVVRTHPRAACGWASTSVAAVCRHRCSGTTRVADCDCVTSPRFDLATETNRVITYSNAHSHATARNIVHPDKHALCLSSCSYAMAALYTTCTWLPKSTARLTLCQYTRHSTVILMVSVSYVWNGFHVNSMRQSKLQHYEPTSGTHAHS